MSGTSYPFNGWDVLKLIGLSLMFVDHAGHFLLPDHQYQFLRAMGRGAAPVFLFLAGYASSYRFHKETLFLGLAVIASNLLLGDYIHSLNILFAILLWRALLGWLERKNRTIKRPFEWMLVCTVFFPVTVIIVQYGTMGLMFAIAGYMMRRPELYTQKQRGTYLILACTIYVIFESALFHFNALNIAVTCLTVFCVYMLIKRTNTQPIALQPAWLKKSLKAASAYSGYIYAIHLIILSWLTGIGI